MCYLALSSITPDGSWAQATSVTPVIAKLFYSIRAVFLFRAFVGREPLQGTIRDRYAELDPWVHEGSDSTFNELSTLQHMASTIAKNTPALPAFIWHNKHRTEFVWDGTLISLSSLQKMGWFILDQLRDSFLKVCMGIHIPTPDFTSDSLTNTTPYYGFANDPRNSKFYLRSHLMKHVITNPDLHSQFIIRSLPNVHIVWNLGRLRQWVADYSEFLRNLMLAIEVLGGSPSRGTELTCIQMVNTPCRTRGIYAIGPHLAILCQYMKTSANTGKDALIPHVLDGYTADITKAALFVLHPFAEQVNGILYSHIDGLMEYWHTRLFINVNKPFTTDDISSGLRIASLKTLGVALGLQDYRQLSVCVRRAHCPTLEELIGISGEDTAGALQAGHTRATEDRLYGVSSGYLGSLPENVLEPYMDASKEWQALMRVPDGGSGMRHWNYDRWQDFVKPTSSPHLLRHHRSLRDTTTQRPNHTNPQLEESPQHFMDPKCGDLYTRNTSKGQVCTKDIFQTI